MLHNVRLWTVVGLSLAVGLIPRTQSSNIQRNFRFNCLLYYSESLLKTLGFTVRTNTLIKGLMSNLICSESMETIMAEHCVYGRPPMVPPFLLNGDDPQLALLRERAIMLGMAGQMVGQGMPMHQMGRAMPMMLRPPTIPNMPSDMYASLFAGSAAAAAAYPSWYQSALASAAQASAFPRLNSGSLPMPQTTMPLALTSSPHLWSTAQSSPQLPLGLTTRKPDSNWHLTIDNRVIDCEH